MCARRVGARRRTGVKLDCLYTTTFEGEGQRNGNSYTATGTMTTIVEPVGKVCFPFEFCQDQTVEGTRVDSNPDECDELPTETRSWGEIKVRYR